MGVGARRVEAGRSGRASGHAGAWCKQACLALCGIPCLIGFALPWLDVRHEFRTRRCFSTFLSLQPFFLSFVDAACTRCHAVATQVHKGSVSCVQLQPHGGASGVAESLVRYADAAGPSMLVVGSRGLNEWHRCGGGWAKGNRQ